MLFSLLFEFLAGELGYIYACYREGVHDSRLTRTESELVQCRKKSGDTHLLKSDLDRKNAWHADDLHFLGIIYLIICLTIFGITWSTPLMFLSLMGSRGIVFNISHNLKIGQDWDHVGLGSIERHFKGGKERLYFGIILLVKLSALAGIIILNFA